MFPSRHGPLMHRGVILVLLFLASLPALAQDHLLPAEEGLKLDPRDAVLELGIAAYPSENKVLQRAAFPTFLEASKAAEKMGLRLIVSADAVRALFDELDDGMTAALLLTLGNGNSNEIQGKVWILRTVLERLVERRAALDPARRAPCDVAIVYVGIALAAGGQAPTLPTDLEAPVRKGVEEAEAADPLAAPYGFLTRHADLPRLRRLDRAVGRGIPLDSDAGVLAALLVQEILLRRNELDDEVALLNHVHAVLCGPALHVIPADWATLFKPGDTFENLSRTPARLAAFRARIAGQPDFEKKKTPGGSVAYVLFDPVEEMEGALFRRLPPDESKGLQTRIVERCRSEGGLRAADWRAGWLSTRASLLESFYRLPGAAVRERAVFAPEFASATFDDFLPPVAAEPATPKGPPDRTAPGTVTPPIPLEPAPEYYLALARAVRNFHKDLADALGLGAMTTLTRLEPSGMPANLRVNADLQRLEEVCYGLHLLAADGLGIAAAVPETELPAADQARRRDLARSFCANLWKEPGLAADSRWAVPVDRVTRAGKTLVRAWASVGVRLVPVKLEYRKPPRAIDAAGKPAQPAFAAALVYLPQRIFKSLEMENLADLTPEGFRQFVGRDYKAPPVKLLPTAGPPPSSRYQGLIFGSCAVGFLVLVAGSIGMFYFKRRMLE